MTHTLANTFADELVSDLHKDARGFRPKAAFMDAWMFATDHEKQMVWDGLVEEMKESEDWKKAAEEQALVLFKVEIARVMKGRGYTWKQAVDLLQKMDHSFGDDQEHFLWRMGLGWSKISEIMRAYNKK